MADEWKKKRNVEGQEEGNQKKESEKGWRGEKRGRKGGAELKKD